MKRNYRGQVKSLKQRLTYHQKQKRLQKMYKRDE